MSSPITYYLTLPTSLRDEWGFFESRGYAPAMPGVEIAYNVERQVHVMAVTEHEAWEFKEEWEGSEASGTCMADLSAVYDFLDQIV